jgi:hypothetical protein
MRGRARAACSGPSAAGILLAMNDEPIDLETLRCGARLAGFAWSDAELEEIRPQVVAGRRVLQSLEAVPLGDVEPATHYRAV